MLQVRNVSKVNLSENNLMNLKTIQKVITTEEEKAVTINEVLDRVLVHYHKSVPFSIR